MACGPYADHFQLPLRQFERWAMMILGFGGVGFMAYGRRLLAVWSPMATRSLTVELNLAFTMRVTVFGIARESVKSCPRADAGNPPVRFDERDVETERWWNH